MSSAASALLPFVRLDLTVPGAVARVKPNLRCQEAEPLSSLLGWSQLHAGSFLPSRHLVASLGTHIPPSDGPPAMLPSTLPWEEMLQPSCLLKPCLRRAVLVNFMCEFGWAMQCTDKWSAIILGFWEGVLGEISI